MEVTNVEIGDGVLMMAAVCTKCKRPYDVIAQMTLGEYRIAANVQAWEALDNDGVEDGVVEQPVVVDSEEN